jgi:hypothetical protein
MPYNNASKLEVSQILLAGIRREKRKMFTIEDSIGKVKYSPH